MEKRKLKIGLVLMVLSQLWMIHGNHAAPREGKPNILLIIVDDLGYGDLGCYGSQMIPTPNIDRLALEGVRLTDGYAAAATCAPSRLGLMTGKYQQRIGGFSNTTSIKVIIPENYLLLPKMLQEAGYHTAHIGKWHINHPVAAVFDEVHNEIKGAADYFPREDGEFDFRLASPMQHGWSTSEGIPDISDKHGDVAVDYIKSRSEDPNPFFLYLSFNAPHSPWQAPLELKEKFQDVSPEVMQLYAAMVYNMDQNIGKVLNQLEESGIADNTLVMFISDNGPEWGRDYFQLNWPKGWEPTIVGSAGPYSGRKAQFLEGGIRVPFIIRWPGIIDENTVYSRPVSALDIYETFRVAAKGPEYPADGVDLIPYLTAMKRGDPHEVIFWLGGESAPVYARMGDWKIVVPQDHTAPSLFDLSRDLGEKQDLSKEKPELVSEMLELVENWRKEIVNHK